MTAERPIAGLVVAGGYSKRFGKRDKALAELAGTPLIRHVVDRLLTITRPLVVNCRAEQVDPFRDALEGCDERVRFAVDPVPDRGPVAGIRTGLAAIDREYVAVVACDMPFVDPELLSELADRAQGSDGAVVQLEDWYQPLQAVYRTESMMAACAETLETGDRRLDSVLERIDVVTVSEATRENVDATAFESIDTPEALDAAERRFDG